MSSARWSDARRWREEKAARKRSRQQQQQQARTEPAPQPPPVTRGAAFDRHAAVFTRVPVGSCWVPVLVRLYRPGEPDWFAARAAEDEPRALAWARLRLAEEGVSSFDVVGRLASAFSRTAAAGVWNGRGHADA